MTSGGRRLHNSAPSGRPGRGLWARLAPGRRSTWGPGVRKTPGSAWDWEKGNWEWWNSNRYLMGLMVTPGSWRPSPRAAINHLYCLLFSPRFGRVGPMLRINHVARLLGIKSFFINAVPKGALILADQSTRELLGGFGSGSEDEEEAASVSRSAASRPS